MCDVPGRRRHDLIKSLEERMAASERTVRTSAAYRDLLRTLEDIEERQRIAAAQETTRRPRFYAEPPLVAADLSTCARARSGSARILLGRTGGV